MRPFRTILFRQSPMGRMTAAISQSDRPLGLLLAGFLAAVLLFPLETTAQQVGQVVTSPPADESKHEPIFGVGPRTIWKNGFGFEAGLDRDKTKRTESWGLDYHTVYGLTADWAVTAEIHQILVENDVEREHGDEHAEEGGGGHGHGGTGFSDLTIRNKYRFFRNDIPGGVFHSAVMGGVQLPTGASGLSSGTTNYFVGLSGAYEGRRWLTFLTGRYLLNTEEPGGLEPGNAVLYDVALGIRPVLTGYYQPDVVLMGELNGQAFGQNELNGEAVTGSSGHRLLVGFGTWLTYRNWAVKPGLQLPLYNGVEGGELDYRFVFAVEFHL